MLRKVSVDDAVVPGENYFPNLVVFADCHIGPRKFSGPDPDLHTKMLVHSFGRAVRWVVASGAKNIIVAGDLFDRRLLPAWIVSRVCSTIISAERRGCRFFALSGNHDVSGRDSALDYLPYVYCSHEEISSVECLYGDTSLPKGMFGVVPFVPGSNAVDEIEKCLKEVVGLCNRSVPVMIGHFGVYDADTEEHNWMKNDPWFVSAQWLAEHVEETGVELVVAGHRHDMRSWSIGMVDVIVPGAMSPITVSETGFGYGNLVSVEYCSNGHVKAHHHVNAIFGVRYVDADDFCLYSSSAYRNSWCFLKDKSVDVETSVPATLEEARGAVTLLNRDVDSGLVEDVDIKDVTVSDAKGAITKYVKEASSSGVFKGPTVGLLDEAVGRATDASYKPSVAVRPSYRFMSEV